MQETPLVKNIGNILERCIEIAATAEVVGEGDDVVYI